MPADKKAPDAMHFRSLRLENVRAFGSSQSLEFTDEDGGISRWNLILGENGVGKTSLMHALAVMRPVPAYAGPEDAIPTLCTAELSESEVDGDIVHFIRRGGAGTAAMTAILTTEHAVEIKVGVTISGNLNENDKLKDAQWDNDSYSLSSGGPLVIGYGAARHVGHHNLAVIEERKATQSLFSDAIDLSDAEEILEGLHYRAISDPRGNSGPYWQRLEMLKIAVARLLPHLTAAQIEINGPRVEDVDQSGVLVHTPSGTTPLADLSLGYQTMFALTVDLAWRLFDAFPESTDPLSESAIVLIDEVDLHLHPQWQRDLRRHLLATFPKIQFIATTHSPITAQETLSEGGTVAVVRWVNGEAQILKHPVPRGEWRSDQLLESKLFEFGSDRSKKTEEKLYRRVDLIRKPNRSAEEEVELRELDEFVASLPTAHSPSAQNFEDLMMNLAKDFPSGVQR